MHMWQSFATDYPNGVNLAKEGSSFYRVVRTTMEFCANNDVGTVLVGLPFIDRYEWPTGAKDSKIEGPYIQSTNNLIRNKALSIYADLGDHSMYYAFDQYITTLIGFCGWLDQQKIDYTIWNMSNNFKNIRLSEYESISKIKYITNNPKIIDLFSFCGNLYLAEKNAAYQKFDESLDPMHRHYSSDALTTILKPFIDDYRARLS